MVHTVEGSIGKIGYRHIDDLQPEGLQTGEVVIRE